MRLGDFPGVDIDRAHLIALAKPGLYEYLILSGSMHERIILHSSTPAREIVKAAISVASKRAKPLVLAAITNLCGGQYTGADYELWFCTIPILGEMRLLEVEAPAANTKTEPLKEPT